MIGHCDRWGTGDVSPVSHLSHEELLYSPKPPCCESSIPTNNYPARCRFPAGKTAMMEQSGGYPICFYPSSVHRLSSVVHRQQGDREGRPYRLSERHPPTSVHHPRPPSTVSHPPSPKIIVIHPAKSLHLCAGYFAFPDLSLCK